MKTGRIRGLGAAVITAPELNQIRQSGLDWCDRKYAQQGNIERQTCAQSISSLLDKFQEFPLTRTGITHLTAKVPVAQAFRDCEQFEGDLFGVCVKAVSEGEKVFLKLLNRKAEEEQAELLKKRPSPQVGFVFPRPGCARGKGLERVLARTEAICRKEARDPDLCRIGARGFIRIAQESFRRGICSGKDVKFAAQGAEDDCLRGRGDKLSRVACVAGVRRAVKETLRAYPYARFR